MRYKCIALDMDGTLLNEKKEVSEANREALLEAVSRGIVIVLATGRAVRQALPYAEQLGLRLPVVANNGAHNWLDADTLLGEYPVDTYWVERLRDLALEHDARYWGHGKQGSFYSHRGPEPFPDVNTIDWFQFAMEAFDERSLPLIRAEVEAWTDVEVSRAMPTQAEINAKGISKASGLLEVCGRLGIAPDEVVAVGDGMNDVAMLRAAGVGVAMGNAEADVKAAASFVAPRNEEDGVAYVVRELLLR